MSFNWDWRATDMRQNNPEDLWKVRKNLGDIQGLVSKGDSILDVGCGRGAFYKALGRSEKYTGIDIDSGEISLAKETWPEADFRVMDLYDLKGEWDVVICSRVLIHLPDFEGAMKVLLGCAKKACALIVAVGADRAESEGSVYFRSFSPQTLSGVGECEIRGYHPYATVIYDRRQEQEAKE